MEGIFLSLPMLACVEFAQRRSIPWVASVGHATGPATFLVKFVEGRVVVRKSLRITDARIDTVNVTS